VVGWQTKKVIQLMGENPGEVILTLKKRPKHGNLMGQVQHYLEPTQYYLVRIKKKTAHNFIFPMLF
jgi:hypothetical protein